MMIRHLRFKNMSWVSILIFIELILNTIKYKEIENSLFESNHVSNISDAPCVPKDSDSCLQADTSWKNWKCSHIAQESYKKKYCPLTGYYANNGYSYAKLTRRCCPDACGQTLPLPWRACD